MIGPLISIGLDRDDWHAGATRLKHLFMNWVPVARHGLILWENEATGSGNFKVSRYLPGLRDAILDQQWTKQSKIQESIFCPTLKSNVWTGLKFNRA